MQSTERRYNMYEFRVYFRDGNQKLFLGENIYDVLQYVLTQNYDEDDVVRVEEV